MRSLAFFFLLLALCFCSSAQTAKENHPPKANEQAISLPFVGKKLFETRPGVSGTGTPHRYIQIEKNGNVYFSFEQENQADGTVTKENFFAGKFRPILKCFFKRLDNETRYYQVSKDRIYEIDSSGTRLTSDECCNSSNIELEGKCPCESKLE